MDAVARDTRSAPFAVAALALIALLIGGCIVERLSTWTPIVVSNESGHDVVVRRDVTKWLVKAGDSGQLWPVEEPDPDVHGIDLEIIDGTTCSTVATVTVPIELGANDGVQIVVPTNGPPTMRPKLKNAEGPTTVRPAPAEVCPDPRDGWALWIANDSPETYILFEYGMYGDPRGNATIEPGRSGLLSANGSGANMTGAGTFVLLDGACHELQRVNHADYGNLVGTINAGKLEIKPGPLPGDRPDLWGSPWLCPPTRPSG